MVANTNINISENVIIDANIVLTSSFGGGATPDPDFAVQDVYSSHNKFMTGSGGSRGF